MPQVLYHLDFHDTTLSGILEHNGEHLYFEHHVYGRFDNLNYAQMVDAVKKLLGDKYYDGYIETANKYADSERDELIEKKSAENDPDVLIQTEEDYYEKPGFWESFYSGGICTTYRLLPNELEVIEEQHREFQKCVGYHTDRGDAYKPFDSTQSSTEEFKNFFANSEAKSTTITSREVVGLFTTNEMINFYQK